MRLGIPSGHGKDSDLLRLGAAVSQRQGHLSVGGTVCGVGPGSSEQHWREVEVNRYMSWVVTALQAEKKRNEGLVFVWLRCFWSGRLKLFSERKTRSYSICTQSRLSPNPHQKSTLTKRNRNKYPVWEQRVLLCIKQLWPVSCTAHVVWAGRTSRWTRGC